VAGAALCRGGPRPAVRQNDRMRQPQSLPQVWARRRRRQRIVAAVISAVLLAALVYGWLYVYGVL
jgi:hypothetical protein